MKQLSLNTSAILSGVAGSALLSATLLGLAAPVMAADYPELRPSYPDQWASTEDNPLHFEAGLRYWYSKGGQYLGLDGDSVRTDDTSHILEGHIRIEDDYTHSYVKGTGGYAFATEGTYSSNLLPGDARFAGGHIGYIGADFGYMPFGNDQVQVGALVGYQYLRESPDKARADILKFDGLNVHALRLGITAKAELGSYVDVTAEVAGIPYARVDGSTPSYVLPPTSIGGITANRLTGTINGAAYGASGELMLGVHPSENLTIRVGGRGWILTGPTSANLTYSNSSAPTVTYTRGAMLDGLALFRYGALVEVTGRF